MVAPSLCDSAVRCKALPRARAVPFNNWARAFSVPQNSKKGIPLATVTTVLSDQEKALFQLVATAHGITVEEAVEMCATQGLAKSLLAHTGLGTVPAFDFARKQ